jgi:hypothetical protein
MKRLSWVLLIVTLILSIFQKPTEEISLYEFFLGGLMATIIFMSLISIFALRHLPRPLFYWFLFGVIVSANSVVALINHVGILEFSRRAIPILAWPACAVVTFLTTKGEDPWRLYKIIYKIVLAALTVPLIYFLFQLIYVWPFFNNLAEILKTITIWHESVGAFAIIVFSLSSPFMEYVSYKVLAILALVIAFFSLVRSLWIGAAVAIAVISFHELRAVRPRQRIRFLFKVMLIVILVFLALKILPESIQKEIVERIESINPSIILSSISFQDRISEAKGLLSELFNNPLYIFTGSGAGSAFQFYSLDIRKGIGWMERTYSHNFYLYLWWAFGVVGLISFLIALLLTLWLAWPSEESDLLKRKMLQGIWLSFFCSAFTANVSSFYDSPKWYILFGILTGIVISLSQKNELRRR